MLIARGLKPEYAENAIRKNGADKIIQKSKSWSSLRELELHRAELAKTMPERMAKAQLRHDTEKLNIIGKLPENKKKDAAFEALIKSGMSGTAALEELKNNPERVFELLQEMSLKELRAFV